MTYTLQDPHKASLVTKSFVQTAGSLPQTLAARFALTMIEHVVDREPPCCWLKPWFHEKFPTLYFARTAKFKAGRCSEHGGPVRRKELRT